MSNEVAQTIGFYGFIFTYPLALIGHACSLLTFSHKSLRNNSTGSLFIFLTISDILYQSTSIYDFIGQVLQISIIRNAYLCRLRTFILNFSTVTSAWLLVLIGLHRFFRGRLPYQQGRICTQKTVSLVVIIVCLFSIVFTCHVLQTEFAFIFPTSILCGPARLPLTVYSKFYYDIWPILQLLITYFIPNCLLMICFICVYSKIRAQRTMIITLMRREKLQQQLFILMISSVGCFSICTLPYSIQRIVFLRSEVDSSGLIAMAILTILLNMNYSYNFYIHCLTSKLFRENFIRQLKKLVSCWKKQRRQHQNDIHPLPAMN